MTDPTQQVQACDELYRAADGELPDRVPRRSSYSALRSIMPLRRSPVPPKEAAARVEAGTSAAALPRALEAHELIS
jgi:hypothetical protein